MKILIIRILESILMITIHFIRDSANLNYEIVEVTDTVIPSRQGYSSRGRCDVLTNDLSSSDVQVQKH